MLTQVMTRTGTTGYIGGDALYALEKAHPDYEYTAMVRNSDRGALVAAVYPRIRLVYGTNDDTKLIEEECAKADIVIRMSYPQPVAPQSDTPNRHSRCFG